MQLALSFSTLLASILVLLSATDNVVQAVPLAKRGKSITLPLTRIHQNRGDVHPQIVSTSPTLRARRSSYHAPHTASAAAHQP